MEEVTFSGRKIFNANSRDFRIPSNHVMILPRSIFPYNLVLVTVHII